jgi:hypothetical protein
MRKFRVEIDTFNAAFEDGAHQEVARILREIADRVEQGSDGGPVRDINGNTVGRYRAT